MEFQGIAYIPAKTTGTYAPPAISGKIRTRGNMEFASRALAGVAGGTEIGGAVLAGNFGKAALKAGIEWVVEKAIEVFH
jgi:hypothetical protein